MYESIESSVLAELENGRKGAEYRVLDTLAKFVLDGIDPSPKFQKVANLIIAKLMVEDKFPIKRKGRPKLRNGIDGELVAARYADLKDSGLSYEQAVSELASNFHKDDRTIMRVVAANKEIVAAKKYLRNLSEHFPNNEVAKELNELTIHMVQLMDDFKTHQKKKIDPQFDLESDRKLSAQLSEQILAAASAATPS